MPTKKQVTKVGEKVIGVAAGATPSGAAVQGGKSAARWALDKYRAYAKAKKDKAAAAAKTASEKRADELYGKGTSIKPKPKPTPAQPTAQPGIKKTMTAIERRNQRLREENPDKK
jgi:hypothetical protein